MPTKRSVVWLDMENRGSIFSRTSTLFSRGSKVELPAPIPSSRLTRGVTVDLSPRRVVAPSPGAWIDLASVASSSVKEEASDSESSRSYKTDVPTDLAESISVKTSSDGWEIAAGYEKEGVPVYYPQDGGEKSDGGRWRRYSIGSKKHQSMLSVQTDSTYPSTFRLTLLTIIVVISTFLVSLDRTIVTTAIPQITNDFHSLSDVSWYGAVYLLTATALQPTWGKMYQIFNLKGIYILVMGIFLLGSLISAVAPNSVVFIIGRAIAGLGCGGLFSGNLTIIAYSVPLRRRAAFTGALGAMFGITTLIGPILGGVFTDHITWRWCFYINLPLGGVTVVGVIFLLQNPGALRNDKTFVENLSEIDYLGPFFFIPAMISLFLALQLGGSTLSWISPIVLGLLCGSAIILPIWIWIQSRLRDRATVPMRVMKQRTVFFSCMFSFCTGAAFVVTAFYLPLYFQAIEGSSAMGSGVKILPLIVAGALSSLVGGIGISMVGYYTPFMILGAAGCTIGLGLMTMLGVETSYVKIMGFQILTGVFMGMNFQTPVIAVQTVVHLRDIPVATSMTLFFNQLGSAVFLFIAQSILENILLSRMTDIDPTLTKNQIISAGATGLKNLVSGDELQETLIAYAKGVDATFIMATVMAGLTVFVACGVEWKSVKSRQVAEEQEEYQISYQ